MRVPGEKRGKTKEVKGLTFSGEGYPRVRVGEVGALGPDQPRPMTVPTNVGISANSCYVSIPEADITPIVVKLKE